MFERRPKPAYAETWLPANFVIFLGSAATTVLWAFFNQTFEIIKQEDGLLEWSTFWAFFVAGSAFLYRALPGLRQSVRDHWFHVGVGLFALIVAFEEISWGQRMFGYLPDEIFLEKNNQIETNLHNFLPGFWLQWSFNAALIAYGVLLPLVSAIGPLGRVAAALGMQGAPAWLTPSFVLVMVMALFTPSGYSNEPIELLFAVGMMFSALDYVTPREKHLGWPTVLSSCALIYALSWIITLGLEAARGDQSEKIAEATQELEALIEEISAYKGYVGQSYGFSSRLHRFVSEDNMTILRRGAFQELMKQKGAPVARARYFLDPWNTPYWVTDRYENGYRRLMFYSLGPNRRSDLAAGASSGDDLMIIAIEEPVIPGQNPILRVD